MYLGMRIAHESVDQMQVFVMIYNRGIVINADVTAKN